jgi:hypothetical protein
MSVHMNVCGNWTKQLRSKFQGEQAGPKDLVGEIELSEAAPTMLVDGPYASPFDHIWDYPVVILASGGIGATPFASVFRHIKFVFVNLLSLSHSYFRAMLQRGEKPPMKKLILVWMCRDLDSFKWFTRDIKEIRDLAGTDWIEFRLHWTRSDGTVPVGPYISKLTTHTGRPEWTSILQETSVSHPHEKVGIFVCGPQKLSESLKETCEDLNDYEHLYRVHSEKY